MTDLYRVIDRNTGVIVEDGFTTRCAAKPVRDWANTLKDRNAVVCRGQDHPKGPTTGAIKSKAPKSLYK